MHQQLLFTWLGQSCTLFQILGVNFLTDPIISEHLITPSIGPKRLTRSPMDLDQIKFATNDSLNFVLVSHDHPDHLELDLAGKIKIQQLGLYPLA